MLIIFCIRYHASGKKKKRQTKTKFVLLKKYFKKYSLRIVFNLSETDVAGFQLLFTDQYNQRQTVSLRTKSRCVKQLLSIYFPDAHPTGITRHLAALDMCHHELGTDGNEGFPLRGSSRCVSYERRS